MATRLENNKFRLQVKNFICEDFSDEEFRLFCWYLTEILPRRIYDGNQSDARTAVLQYLEDQCIIKRWRENPTELEEILKEAVNRPNLAAKLIQFDNKAPIQETADTHTIEHSNEDQYTTSDGCTGAHVCGDQHPESQKVPTPSCSALLTPLQISSEPPTSVSQVTKRNTSRGPKSPRPIPIYMDTLPEEEQIDGNTHTPTTIRQSVTGNFEEQEIAIALNVRQCSQCKRFYEYTTSEETRRNYGTKTIDGLITDFNTHCKESNACTDNLETQSLSDGFSDKECVNQHKTLERTSSNISTISQLSAARSSGYYSQRNSGLSILSQDYPDQYSFSDQNTYTVENGDDESSSSSSDSTNIPCDHDYKFATLGSFQDDPVDDFRPRVRSSSLPSRGIDMKMVRKFGKLPNFQRTTSNSSVDSVTTADSSSQYSSQVSLNSTDTGSSDTDKGSVENLSGITRCHKHRISSQLRITGEMELRGKSLHKDVRKKHNSLHKSGAFPRSEMKCPRFQMRFFTTNFKNDAAALYIDLDPDYCLSKFKHKNEICIPAMEVTVSISYQQGLKAASTSGHSSRGVPTIGPTEELKNVVTSVRETSFNISALSGNVTEGSSGASKCDKSTSKENSNYITIASFPQFVSHKQLLSTDASSNGGMFKIHVVMECT